MEISKKKSDRKIKIFGFEIGIVEIFAFIIVTAITVALRVYMFPHESNDYKSFLLHWYNAVKDAGGIKGIGISIGDYTPLYIYCIAVMTYIPIKALYLIKILSVIFDFLLAVFVFKLTYKNYKNIWLCIILYGITLVLPTLIINSAYWAQCDIIYTFFCVMCVWYTAKNKPLKAMIMFSVAFCFKLQAIFLAPFILLCILKNKIKIRYIFVVPIVYIISILPAFIAGRSFSELLAIYFKQSGEYTKISLNAPNIWYYFENNTSPYLTITAIMLCGILMLTAIIYMCYKEFNFNENIYFTTALFFAILIPFFLPRMHERYFFLADILAFIFAIYNPKKFYIPLLIGFSSLCAYSPFIFHITILDIRICAVLMFLALVLVGISLYKQINNSKATEKKIHYIIPVSLH